MNIKLHTPTATATASTKARKMSIKRAAKKAAFRRVAEMAEQLVREVDELVRLHKFDRDGVCRRALTLEQMAAHLSVMADNV